MYYYYGICEIGDRISIETGMHRSESLVTARAGAYRMLTEKAEVSSVYFSDSRTYDRSKVHMMMTQKRWRGKRYVVVVNLLRMSFPTYIVEPNGYLSGKIR